VPAVDAAVVAPAVDASPADAAADAAIAARTAEAAIIDVDAPIVVADAEATASAAIASTAPRLVTVKVSTSGTGSKWGTRRTLRTMSIHQQVVLRE
jgi:hypothetical protein